MKPLRDIILEAKHAQCAIGHFNISDFVAFKAALAAAQKLNVPLLIGTSEGERDFLSLEAAVALVKGVRERADFPVFLNADHSRSFERVKAAVDAGYDSVHFDGSALPYDENLRVTKECVEYARGKNPDISVEGELGYIATESSKVYEGPVTIKPEQLTHPEQARAFAESTGIDRLAVAIGEIHGISLAGNPHLDIERLKAIAANVPDNVSITLHGGSGIPAEEIKAALPHGLSNIHINTEIRVAYHKALAEFFRASPKETTPYKFLAPGAAAMQALIEEKLHLFGN